MTGFGDLNLKFRLTLAISVFMSSLSFMLSRVTVEHEKSFIKSQPLEISFAEIRGILYSKRSVSELRVDRFMSGENLDHAS